jgi:TetR/AcrR family transcriptional regulator, ethionamide resistance regulator
LAVPGYGIIYTLTISSPTRRRRRSPEEAEREILDAAERIVRERPPPELTVTSVMEDTTLTRNAFYAYFRDRYDLIARLVERLRADADAGMAAYVAADEDFAALGREALASAARLWSEHGELLRALSEAAASDDAAARAWAEFTAPTYEAVMARVREDMREGRISRIDPEPTVRALVAMNRATFMQELVGKPDADLERVVDALHLIWVRALYARDP